MVHTRSWINAFVCRWYIHVHECKYMYGHSLYRDSFTTWTTLALHFPSGGPIGFVTPASLWISSAQATPAFFLSLVFMYIHCTYMLFITVHPCMYIVHTCLYMSQTCSSSWLPVHGSSWFILVHCLDVRCLYSPVLGCTTFKQCYGTGISHLVHTGRVHTGMYPLRMALAGG